MKEPKRCRTFASRKEWRAWLMKHHANVREAWLLHYKKGAATRSLTYEEAVEEALCFGWIDGLLRSIDDETYALRYSPRKPRSTWSEINKRRAERLIKHGQMSAAGLAKIAEAQANGEWEAATIRENVTMIPVDLLRELKKNKAWGAFRNWPASRKKQYLSWLSSAKKPETRRKRVRTIVEMATGNE
jgi:uncharacterized protein YdeI (YjbR/CyaY-like superfamily)